MRRDFLKYCSLVGLGLALPIASREEARAAERDARSDAPYARAELWVRKDNFLPLRMQMFSRSGALLKTLTTQEVRRIGGRWFISRSTMVSHEAARQTELAIEQIEPRADLPDGDFTVRNLEKL